MPYLRFKGFDEKFVRQQAPLLVEEFSRVAAVPREIVKVELLSITQITPTPRSLEIYMFPRTQEKHDAIAANLHDMLSRHGYRDVHIFFVLLSPSLYYKEGMPLQNISWLPASS
ncbi:MAG: DUF1904 family protein [Desulfuromonadaceae bacterium]|nr:DUF1904 family protein [Desulfuromonadaceae bacterium]